MKNIFQQYATWQTIYNCPLLLCVKFNTFPFLKEYKSGFQPFLATHNFLTFDHFNNLMMKVLIVLVLLVALAAGSPNLESTKDVERAVAPIEEPRLAKRGPFYCGSWRKYCCGTSAHDGCAKNPNQCNCNVGE